MRRLYSPAAPAALASLVFVAVGAAWLPSAHAEDLPKLKWGDPVRCLKNQKGEEVRVQCDPASPDKRCLVAPNQMSYGGDLHHVQDCDKGDEPIDAYQKLVDSGAHMVRALAEVPPGYARADTGRAFQVKFDLLNRIYLGLSWVPTFQRETGLTANPSNFPFGRAQADTGFDLSVLSPRGRSRHDFRILEGSVTFSDLEIKGLLFAYDYQHEHRRPAFWLSTFFGPPKVHEVTPALGWGFRIVNINDRPPAFQNTLDVEFAEAHASWNPWQSNDMYSHLRLEAGLDFGKYWPDRGEAAKGLGSGHWYGGISTAVKSRFSLGDGGLHYIFVDGTYLRPTIAGLGKTGSETVNKVNVSVAYEGIFIAINDQPLSVRLAASGAARDDPATNVTSFELRFMAGLHLSFWAPPRVFEPLPEIEDP